MDIVVATQRFISLLSYFSEEDLAKVEQALTLAARAHEGQTRSDGTPYILHPIATAQILAEWHADLDTVIVGLLHDVPEDTHVKIEEIEHHFGKTVANLVEGVTKFDHADFEGQSSMNDKIETLRRLFEVMRRDIRVAVIKLADRLHNIRTIAGLPPEKRVIFAKETLDIYYKLAFHLGMNSVRREFSAICMPLVHPKQVEFFNELRREGFKNGREAFHKLLTEMKQYDLKGTLVEMKFLERSYYRMLQEMNDPQESIDPFCVVVTAKDRDGCYELLKLFHTHYRPISRKFRDYIAAPTENGYQAIRTSVMGPEGVVIPLRIRTEAMEKEENLGVVLKCFGKESGTIPGFSWLERSESIDSSTKESSESFWKGLQSDIFQETINVNIDGEEVSVPRGATALDAVYATLGGKANALIELTVNGSHVPYGSPLQEEDAVSIMLDEGCIHANHDWLQKISTGYARNVIVESLKNQDQSQKLAIGERLLQKEFDHFHLGPLGELGRKKSEELAQHFNRDTFDEVVSMVGEGVLHPRDVMLSLTQPSEKRALALDKKYQFSLRISGDLSFQKETQSQFTALAYAHDIDIRSTRTSTDRKHQMFHILLSGLAANRVRYADFIDAVERQQTITKVRTLLSPHQRLRLLSIMLGSFLLILLDVVWLPFFHVWTQGLHVASYTLVSVIPMIPIIVANFVVLNSLQKHIVFLRTDRWYIGLAFLMNISGVVLVIGRTSAAENLDVRIFPLVALFVLSMLYIGYRFVQSESLFHIYSKNLRPLSSDEWKVLKKRKITGYTLRLIAVILWGLFPLHLKYTPTNDVDPFLRVFFMSIGAIVVTLLFIALQKAAFPRIKLSFRLPKNIHLANMVIGDAGLMYFAGASLLFTTSTNYLLLQNFAPVMALIIAVVLWRHSLPYLKNPSHVVWIFLIFLLGSTGSSFIIYNSIQSLDPGTAVGDILSIITMFFDTLLVIGQIRYMKLMPKAWGPAINLHLFIPIVLITAPFIFGMYFLKASSIASLTSTAAISAIITGVILGFGELLQYETFRRIDGFIAFLMFNISILITFIVEVFFLHRFTPTWMLLVGGCIIIASTIFAELVNTRCEKQGY